MSPSRAVGVLLALALVAAAARCGPVSRGETPDAGACPGGCPDGQVCVNGYCVDPEDPCAGVSCREGTHCVDGLCVEGEEDPCDGVTCEPDEVCRDGECVSASADDDEDGYPASEDCDDGDREVHPGADERCNGEDDDCDGDEDEDIPSRSCVTDCGTGTETCEDGAWVCSVPDVCECPGPGETETRDCGRCGTETRTCGDDWTWGDFGPCEGDVDCPVVCDDGYCDDTETCSSCPEDCGYGHMGDGDHGDPCSAPAETWRCVHSSIWDGEISQVCRGGVWQTYATPPIVDCRACCGVSSPACEQA